ncbi:hypothetical protein [Sediminibacillus massiliensis]|uniref:hypothetical protein n=1 Tax=Sediminibacillus massiliensis TaxID=1926277 RepID=UPI000988463E|nr:hypothetical protein [Sediminibacillus massiliensis]
MRYTDRITLHKSTGRQYNPGTGKTEVSVDEGVILPCNFSTAGPEKTATTFGSITQEIGIARLQRPFKGEADRAVVNGKKYNVLRHVPYRSESVFYLESVTAWN